MSILDNAYQPTPMAPIITITGRAGSGKTSLAVTFGKTLVIQAEDSAQVLTELENKPDLLPLIETPTRRAAHNPLDEVLAVFRELYKDPRGYQCVVIDSVTSLSTKMEAYIIATESPNKSGSIAETMGSARGGYNKAYELLSSYHEQIIDAAGKLRNHRNMTIIFIAHEGSEKIKNDPQEMSEYTISSLQMHKDSAKHYVNNSDAVLFIDVAEAIIGGGEKGEKLKVVKTLGERIIYTNNMSKFGLRYAKNRFDMPSALTFEQGINPIMQYIPFFKQQISEEEK